MALWFSGAFTLARLFAPLLLWVAPRVAITLAFASFPIESFAVRTRVVADTLTRLSVETHVFWTGILSAHALTLLPIKPLMIGAVSFPAPAVTRTRIHLPALWTLAVSTHTLTRVLIQSLVCGAPKFLTPTAAIVWVRDLRRLAVVQTFTFASCSVKHHPGWTSTLEALAFTSEQVHYLR